MGAAAACLWAQAAHAEVRLRVGVYQNSPKVDVDPAGRAGGIFVDVLDEIAKREGWTIEYVPGSWHQGLQRLGSGQIDLMTDVAQTSERTALYRFHAEPVLSSWNEVYAREGSGIRSLLDLAGRRVAVLQGSMQQDYLRNLARGFRVDFEIVEFAGFAQAFSAVQSGRADAVVTNRFYGLRHARAYRLEPTAILFNPSELFFAASLQADPQVLTAIDRRLLEMKRDSSSPYYASLRRWGAEDEPGLLPPWFRWALPVAALLLALSLGWALTVRRQAERLQRSETIQRQLATDRQQMLTELERRARALEQTGAELALARDAAQAADRTKSAFLATMSHELRTPLNSIIGFTGIVLQELPGPLNGEQKKQLGMVRDSARHLLALINDVLDISKIEAGEIRIVAAPFDLAESVAKVGGLVEPLARRKALELGVTVGPGVRAVSGDGRRIEQILLNLLSNAIKFTDKGQVELRVQRGSEPGWVSMSVRDSGIGIREEDMAVLFQPFRQIDSALSRTHEGTGLGLAICSRLAALMGGRIEVSSRWGHGSTFTVLLPLAPVVEELAA